MRKGAGIRRTHILSAAQLETIPTIELRGREHEDWWQPTECETCQKSSGALHAIMHACTHSTPRCADCGRGLLRRTSLGTDDGAERRICDMCGSHFDLFVGRGYRRARYLITEGGSR
jgi:hypothetical protein